MTLLSHLARLQERGRRVLYCDSSPLRRKARLHGVECRTYRDPHELQELVAAFRPSVVLACLTGIELALELSCPVVAYLQCFSHSPPDAAERESWGVGSDYQTVEAVNRLLDRADRVLVNSQFMADRLERTWGRRCSVLYPEILPLAPLRRPGSAVTGVCGFPHKGSDIFLELARRCPDRPFLLAGALHPAVARAARALSNLTHVPFGPAAALLRRSAVVLVPSRWPEPFGRIAVEARAVGLPCLASHTGGLPEIVGEGVRDFRNPEAWLDALRACPPRLLPADSRFTRGDSARWLDAQLPRAPGRVFAPGIRFDARTDRLSAYSRLAARWQEAARPQGDLPEAWIHLDFSQEFGSVRPPATGYAVAVRPWDFGPYPPAWAERIGQDFDQLWVFSRWARACALRAGVPARRVRVVPPGFDPTLFAPEGPRFELESGTRLRFLFVGAPIHRKGFDLLLRSWRDAFGDGSRDVELVLKIHSRDVFYQGIGLLDELGEKCRVIDEELSTQRLSALYRACDVGVYPYRAEGFGIPILESMACARPCLVPDFGACRDFCRPDNAFLVRPRRIQLPVERSFAINTLGFQEHVEEVDFCQLEVGALAQALRAIADMPPAERARRGRAAHRLAHERFTWEHSWAHARRALLALRGTPCRFLLERERQRRDYRRREAARAMFFEGR